MLTSNWTELVAVTRLLSTTYTPASPRSRLRFDFRPVSVYHSSMTDSTTPAPVRMVKCVKLGQELPGLAAPPWPGEIGQRIFEQV